eukprot:453195-Amphidinium_carterae.1
MPLAMTPVSWHAAQRPLMTSELGRVSGVIPTCARTSTATPPRVAPAAALPLLLTAGSRTAL